MISSFFLHVIFKKFNTQYSRLKNSVLNRELCTVYGIHTNLVVGRKFIAIAKGALGENSRFSLTVNRCGKI